MSIEDLEYYKKLIIQKRKQFIETDNFTNWFADKINGYPNEGGELRDNPYCLSGENESSYNKNDIHLKAKILQYILQLDHALIQIRKENFETYNNNIEEILKNHLEEFSYTQDFPKCE